MLFAGNQCLGYLYVHDIDLIVAYMLFQGSSKLGALSVFDRDEVFYGQGIEDLTPKALGHNTGSDALACGIHSRCCSSRATAHNQDIKRLPVIQGLYLVLAFLDPHRSEERRVGTEWRTQRSTYAA